MKKDLLHTFRIEIILCIASILLSMGYSLYDEKTFDWCIIGKDWVRSVVMAIIIPSLYLNIHLWRKIKKQWSNPLSDIFSSKIIREKAYDFGANSITLIVDKLNTMLNINGVSTILWELDGLNLTSFETKCSKCEDNISTDCATIKNMITTKRRNRITEIAQCLILKKGDVFFATETRLPSEIIGWDKDYYEEQKQLLFQRGIKTRQRILILSNTDLINEVENNENKQHLADFIQWHKKSENKNDECDISLKIITYSEEKVNKSAVFDNKINNELLDFIVSKKGKNITVFAQSPNILASFDSANENKAKYAKQFYDIFKDLYGKDDDTEKINKEYISYSKKIEAITDVENFVNQLK